MGGSWAEEKVCGKREVDCSMWPACCGWQELRFLRRWTLIAQ